VMGILAWPTLRAEVMGIVVSAAEAISQRARAQSRFDKSLEQNSKPRGVTP